MSHPVAQPLTAYQRKLFVFLGVATFFEGFDQMALAQILPTLRDEMHLGEWETGLLVAFVNLGTVVAYLLVRQADVWGRRAVLSLTIAGYTLFSFASGLVSSPWLFGALQFVARIFLIGEWAVSVIYAAEEFPASRRGMVIGVISAWSALGAVVCAGVVPLLVRSPFGWRTVYFVGTVPLVLLAFARRSLRETDRFAALAPEERVASSLTRILHTPYRARVLQLALIWGLTYVCTQTAVTFFKQHAVEDLGMPDTRVGLLISVAAVVSMPLVFAVGRLLDVTGRRRGSVVIFVLTAAGALGSYTLEGEALLFGPVVLAIFGASAVLPALNAFTTELFPTELRSDAFAWSNNLLGRLGYVVAPIAVGLAAEEIGWGLAVASTAIGPILALVLILKWLPETRGRELEDTSAMR
ncbi:MFS transporter [Sandaracinus amylolyticus]|uniref:Sialic acid transporter (Permease) NanT n=1 Tax=Sandaracinus amylolyticus TaxID=927083 RepID=A0A0F6YGW5_9BACT|nr:MFS transporter [Sandaracinus amylolyticus]AKF04135.1 Sialic acid transporter (permease) NanT [Sandaracinus amylolyticus]